MKTSLLIAACALLAGPAGAVTLTFDTVQQGGLPGPVSMALLHKSAADRTSPFPGQIYPATSVMGVPSAVKPLSTATRTWNSAT